MSADFGEQLTFSGLEPQPKKRSSRNSTAGAPKITVDLPVASVVLEKLPVHLDQTFDYLVPEKFASVAVPGAAVKVPFGGQQLDGYIVDRLDSSTHTGRLAPLKSVVSQVPLISDDSLKLLRGVADYYGGSLSDILRLAVPPRHASTEKAFISTHLLESEQVVMSEDRSASQNGEDIEEPHEQLPDLWSNYAAGKAFVERVVASCNDDVSVLPRAVWTALPGYGTHLEGPVTFDEHPHWALALAQLSQEVQKSGKRSLIILPTAKDVKRLGEALLAVGFAYGSNKGGRSSFVTLTYDLSAAERYGNYLLASNGFADVLIGTRAAAFTPLERLGLVACWDDGDSSHQDLHAPYPHSREIISLRSELSNCALVVGGFGRTLHAQSLLSSGWAGEIAASRDVVRAGAPLVVEFGEFEIEADSGGKQGRLPRRVWSEITKALKNGPVLIQVPRGGYVPYVACSRCREAAHCRDCNGPLGLTDAQGAPQCRWCGALSGTWACGSCGFSGLRAIRVGSERTAEELGRAFPGVPVVSSGAKARGGVATEVAARPSLIIATPGAEPHVPGGYVLTVLLDAHLSSGGSGLYADQEALRGWQNAAGLNRSRTQGGRVYLVGRGAKLPTAALVRWDAPGLAARELEERSGLHLPPSWRVAAITGDRSSVAQFMAAIKLPPETEVLGPVVTAEQSLDTLDEVPHVRTIVRVPMRKGRDLARSLNAMARIASAKRQTHRVDVVLDPKELL